MAKKEKKVELGSGYSYMDTYGDMVTLLLTFFVLLFSFSSTDTAKWKLLVEAFTGSPPTSAVTIQMSPITMGGNSFTSNNTTGNANQQQLADAAQGTSSGSEAQMTQQEVEQQFDELYERMQTYIQENDLSDQLVVEKNAGTITLRVVEGILFDSGSADIKASEDMILRDIGNMIASSIDAINIVEVEGHTDNVPINTPLFQDNWDLSSKRATNTIRFLNSMGIPPTKLSASGYGEFKPFTTNDTEEGRRQNRRVEFIIERRNVDLGV